jgi:hypothetical protein
VAQGGFHEWRNPISRQSRRTVGVVLFVMPTVLFGAPRLRNLLSERSKGGGSLSAALMEELKRVTGEGRAHVGKPVDSPGAGHRERTGRSGA